MRYIAGFRDGRAAAALALAPLSAAAPAVIPAIAPSRRALRMRAPYERCVINVTPMAKPT